MQMHSPAHPGLILRECMGDTLTVTALARHLGMTRANLSMILNGRLSVSAAMALKFSEAFPHTSPDLWLKLQAQYDLAEARKQKRKPIKPALPVAA